MRYLLTLFIAAAVAIGVFAAPEKKAAPKLTFQTKFGNVVYDHEAHSKREKDDCKVCHDKLWPQDAKAPVNFKGGAMHAAAEKSKSSCAACHVTGGKAFAVKGSCNKCHVKAGAKKG
jgi:c(7)-type cytochrome triheme protein